MMDLQAQYHFNITADKRIERLQNISDQLTVMINRSNLILKPMQLIHITTQEQYDVVVKAMALKGMNPARDSAIIRGDRYISVEDQFLAYSLSKEFVEQRKYEVIPFDEFIKEVA